MSVPQTKQLPHHSEIWKGYTLEELRYMRAYTAARIEISNDRVKRTLAGLHDSTSSGASGLFGKVLGSLSYFDLALLVYRIGSKAFKAARWLRRK